MLVGGRSIPDDGITETQWLVMKVAVNKLAQDSESGFHQDHTPLSPYYPGKFVQSAPWPLQMVKHVEKEEVRNGGVCEREAVGILDSIKPEIGKNVGRDAVRDKLFYGANTRAQFDDRALDRAQLSANQAIEDSISTPKNRPASPNFFILPNFD
jgi:hypothetical protein